VASGDRQRIIVGISGASGIVYGVRMLEVLRKAGVETHLVMTKAAEMTLGYESELKAKDVRDMADVAYPIADIGAIATGVTSTLISRAADVVLKERRRLVLAVRETPLHSGHLRTMLQLSDMGAIISPLMPAFYNKPQSVEDIIDHSVGRIVDLFGLDAGIVKRWKGDGDKP